MASWGQSHIMGTLFLIWQSPTTSRIVSTGDMVDRCSESSRTHSWGIFAHVSVIDQAYGSSPARGYPPMPNELFLNGIGLNSLPDALAAGRVLSTSLTLDR